MNSPTYEAIRAQALSLGWDDVGITAPTIPDEDIQAYRSWLANGQHAQLSYMENDLRCYPEQLLPGAKTALIFVSNYKQEKLPFRSDAAVVASYARGRDYHNIHRKRLKKLIAWMEAQAGVAECCKGFSDSKPILEKALAVQAGLGWMGKNTLLIHRRFGTFTLLSGLLTTLAIPYEAAKAVRLPRCGTCTRCLDACPTQALLSPYTLDANRCLSNHLIESEKEIPANIRAVNPGYAFGCDICQDVCPHNQRSPLAIEADFNPASGFGGYLTEELLQTIERTPDKLNGTPLKRRGAAGLRHTWKTLMDDR